MESLFIGKNVVFLPEVESTNTYAMELLRNVNALDGTIVFTDHQTKGKGQRGALWHSAIAENIILSVILKPHFLSLKHTFYLSKITALALYDLLTETLANSQCDIKIKWPNDILVQNRKIAGILIENNISQNRHQYAVVGIGLNVNQTQFNDLENSATSLQKITHTHFDRTLLQQRLLAYLEKWYLKLKEGKLTLIDDAYLNCLFGKNELHTFIDTQNQTVFEGKIINVEVDGKLAIELNDLSLRYFELKEVKLLL